jgi:hypothetical protein
MNKQEMFNKVWFGLQGQDWKQSVDSFNGGGNQCAYRGANGAKCAAGHLIPDENYDEEFEGCGIGSLLNRYPMLFNEAMNQECVSFIKEMQAIHDSGDDSMQDGFVWLAQQHDLTIPEQPST